MKNVCLAIIAMLLMVHLSCDACDVATAGECESCLNDEPTTMQCVIRDLSMGSLSGAAVLLKVEEVLGL